MEWKREGVMDGDSGDEDNDVAVIVKQTNFTLFHFL